MTTFADKRVFAATAAPTEGPDALRVETLPAHVALIMDGNGRWAKQRHQPRIFGHRKGADTVRRITEAAAQWGVKAITLYSFSTENWKRPADEVTDLMGLLRIYLKGEVKSMIKNGIKLRVIGNRHDLAPDLRDLIEDVEAKTAQGSNLLLQLAVSYGARQDIVSAAKSLALDVSKGVISADQVTEEALSARLSTSEAPDLDLVIRTSGEQRLSNFMLWECAYSEFYFADVLWPDFDETEFRKALSAFGSRDRRFGGLR